MIVTAIKTRKITPKKDANLFAVLDTYISEIQENTVLAVTSKIVAICEGRVLPIDEADKDELIANEAEYFLPRDKNKYQVSLTIKNGNLIATAGIDESNASGFFVLWPENPQESANKIREYLQNKFKLKNVGVIITDSKTTPLRWGVTGIAIAYSGFNPLHNYIGTPDIFGRNLKMTKMSVQDGLAAAATLVMGEGNEQTPFAIITDVPFVEFVNRNPTQEELKELRIDLEDDLYASLLTSVDWQKGK